MSDVEATTAIRFAHRVEPLPEFLATRPEATALIEAARDHLESLSGDLDTVFACHLDQIVVSVDADQPWAVIVFTIADAVQDELTIGVLRDAWPKYNSFGCTFGT